MILTLEDEETLLLVLLPVGSLTLDWDLSLSLSTFLWSEVEEGEVAASGWHSSVSNSESLLFWRFLAMALGLSAATATLRLAFLLCDRLSELTESWSEDTRRFVPCWAAGALLVANFLLGFLMEPLSFRLTDEDTVSPPSLENTSLELAFPPAPSCRPLLAVVAVSLSLESDSSSLSRWLEGALALRLALFDFLDLVSSSSSESELDDDPELLESDSLLLESENWLLEELLESSSSSLLLSL